MFILITGSGGMLAQALAQTLLPGEHTLHVASREGLDITDADAVSAMVREMKPDVIINAAAYTAVDQAEEEEALATAINGDGVRNLVEAARAVGAKFVHYSTDYVFAGDRKQGYDESFDGYDPVNAYGRSKLLGEKAIGEIGGDTYIIRTSWLYGPGGKNFVETMLTLSGKLDELNVIADQHGKPTYTVDLSAATKELIEGDYASGIYHVSNETPQEGITWYDFAVEIFRLQGIDMTVNPIPTSEYPTPAARPAYSMLINTKLPPRRDWKEALAEYLNQRE